MEKDVIRRLLWLGYCGEFTMGKVTKRQITVGTLPW